MSDTVRKRSYRRTPHPKEPEIRELLARGMNNATVVDLLNVPVRQVARIRRDMGIGPAPRSSWRNRPHPKTREITDLLEDGHTSGAIRRRTGADWDTIARMRAALRVGDPTITLAPPHPKEQQVRALLATHGNKAIAAQLGMDPRTVRTIREAAGIPYVPQPRGYATAEDKWAALVRPVDGGHLEWTGERVGAAGTPVMRFRERSMSPAGIAFRKRTGRDPVGQVRPECDYPHCVAPACVQDEPGRKALRLTLRRIKGMPDPPPQCTAGHDQATHGRLDEDGRHYCEACKRNSKRTAGRPPHPSTGDPLP